MFELDPTPSTEIEQLELRIEELSEAIQRSRRLGMVGRVAVVAGLVALVGLVLGLMNFELTRVIVAISLALGGVVLMGSSKTSTEQLQASLKQAQSARNAAIDALDLVAPSGGLLH
jgi:HAMP domain-containing protein